MIRESTSSPRQARIQLSVVVAAWNGLTSLRRCLESLGPIPSDMEVIVVSNSDRQLNEVLTYEFPDVRYLAAPCGTTVPILRSLGVAQAQGEIVALAEDHCTFGPRWCSELTIAHKSDYPVIGGAVENSEMQSPLDWAVYFYDYGKFMLPCAPGLVDSLPGNNVSYKRNVLWEIEDQLLDGFWEPFVHGELARRGNSLYLAPSVVVYHAKNYRMKEAVCQAYHLGRSFAAKRLRGGSGVRRAVFVVGSLALPLLLPSRIILRVLHKRRHVKQLLASLPYIVLLTSSWSTGEFCGYLFGLGRSTEYWK